MKKIVQIAHVTEIPGPVQTLARYIKKNSKADCFQILHPLDASIRESKMFSNGKALAQKKRRFFSALSYLYDFFLTIFWLGKIKGPVETAIGMNPFDTLPLVLRKKKFKKVIFFGTDFSRKRFDNFILNCVYVAIDKYCAKKADVVCCNTQRAIEARTKNSVSKNKLVFMPNGVFLDEIGAIPPKKTFEKKLVYVGHLSKDRGLVDIIKILGDAGLALDIIGFGPAEKELRNIARKYNLADKVVFLGRFDHDQVIEYLKNFSGFALAPYNSESDWTFYCDPVKAKEYLACGIPVIISAIPEISEMIARHKLGFVYIDIARLKDILSEIKQADSEDYFKLAGNVARYKKDFDLNIIYKKII